MSEHCITLSWNRTSEDFQIKNYNRAHEWDFGNGNIVKASAAKDYMGDAEMVDPEQAFVASIAACHMLTFLAIASQKKYTIDSYKDDAVGILAKNEQGKMAVTEVILHPHIQFSGDTQPSAEDLKKLHDAAHHNCFIANSITTKVRVEQ